MRYVLLGNILFLLSGVVFAKPTSKPSPKSFTEKEIEALLASPAISPENLELYKQLGYYYELSGNKEKAVEIYKMILAYDENQPEHWMEVIENLFALRKRDEAIKLLKMYLKKFPTDTIQSKTLLGYYLYELKDADALSLYHDYIKAHRDISIALDVGNLLLEKGRKEKALEWYTQMHYVFPSDKTILDELANIAFTLQKYDYLIRILAMKSTHTLEEQEYLVDAYEAKKDIPNAIAWLEKIQRSHPTEADAILRLAYLHSLMGNREKAAELFEHLAEVKKDDPQVLKLVGKEIHLLGNPKLSLKYLHLSRVLDPSDPETWYWIAESAESDNQRELPKLASRELTALLSTPAYSRTPQGELIHTEEEERMYLKSQGRLHFTPKLEEKYLAAIEKYPANIDLRTDLVMLAINNKRMELAGSILNRTRIELPEHRQRLYAFEAYYALNRKRWKEAEVAFENTLKENPHQWVFRRDLAEAAYLGFRFKRARDEFQSILSEIGNDVYQLPFLTEIYEKYDYRYSGLYDHITVGEDSGNVGGVGYHGLITPILLAFTDIRHGFYRIRSESEGGVSGGHDASFSQSGLSFFGIPYWVFSAGIKSGKSDMTGFLFGPFLRVRHEVFGHYAFELFAIGDALRTDLPTAISSGARESFVEFSWDTYIFWWFNFTGKVLFEHNEIFTHASADAHTGILEFFLIFAPEKPYFSLSYRFTAIGLSQNGDFDAVFSLIDVAEEHVIALNFSHWIHENFYFALAMYIGTDDKRDLDFRENWGLSGALKVLITDWIDLIFQWNFASVSLATGSGQSIGFNVALSAHWM